MAKAESDELPQTRVAEIEEEARKLAAYEQVRMLHEQLQLHEHAYLIDLGG